jgi:hypothetical protein
MLDSNHRAMPTDVSRGDTYFGRDPGPNRVVVGPNEIASFLAAWGHVPTSPERPCATSTYVQLTPPDETEYLVTPAAIDACGGSIRVTAIVAGSNGPPQ